MDVDQFASILAPFTTAPSRRTVARSLAGLAAGTIFAPLLDPAYANARRKKRKGRKKKKSRTALPPCPTGQTHCGNACIDVNTDTANCGRCGNACGEGLVCTGGACGPVPPTCSDGIRNGDEADVDCGGSCSSACTNGKACGADPDCQSGHCVLAVCRECDTAGHCGAGKDCVGGECCTVNGFESINACTADHECCSGHCATHGFGTTCRPVGCLPPGVSCGGNSSVCCSFTCSVNCQ